MLLKTTEKIIQENAFEQNKNKPSLNLTLGLMLIGLRTTGPCYYVRWTQETSNCSIATFLAASTLTWSILYFLYWRYCVCCEWGWGIREFPEWCYLFINLLPHIKIAIQNFKLMKQRSPCRSIWLIKGTTFKNIHD